MIFMRGSIFPQEKGCGSKNTGICCDALKLGANREGVRVERLQFFPLVVVHD
jgi:hypothetical protein